ncbi:MAG: twin-arginine translocase subunit TatC [Gammaproteobacteria bacterium]|jgi:sec-independent protein translocase protein TatC
MTDTTKNQKSDSADDELPFLSHLFELRDRLIRIVIVVGLIFVVLFYFDNYLYEFISHPLLKYLPDGKMQSVDVIGPIFTPMKLALMVSFYIGVPYILHQIWGFIAPGLYKHEKRLAMPLLVSSVLLFYTGMAFAYYVMFPLMFRFLYHVLPSNVVMQPDITHYLNFVLKLFFAFGVSFEIPIAVFLLIWLGVTTPKKLSRMRPYVIVIAFTLGMLLTPPDILSQVMLAIPMWFLFESGIFFAKIALKKRLAEREREEAEAEAQDAEEDEELDGDAELDAAMREEDELNKRDPD